MTTDKIRSICKDSDFYLLTVIQMKSNSVPLESKLA